jgi:hypothetical protein
MSAIIQWHRPGARVVARWARARPSGVGEKGKWKGRQGKWIVWVEEVVDGGGKLLNFE